MHRLWITLLFGVAAVELSAQNLQIKCTAATTAGVPAYLGVPSGLNFTPNGNLHCGTEVNVVERRVDGWSKVALPVSGKQYYVRSEYLAASVGAGESQSMRTAPNQTQQRSSSLGVFALLMTEDELRNTGVANLNDSQRDALVQWLAKYTRIIKKTDSESSAPTANPNPARTYAAPQETRTPSVIESQIEGDFEGWSGETIFKLTNGQIWQQSEYDYTYEYAYRPDVLIYWSSTSSCYKLKVEDVGDQICVKRLK